MELSSPVARVINLPSLTGETDSFGEVAAIHLTVTLVMVVLGVLEGHLVWSSPPFVLVEVLIEYLLSSIVIAELEKRAGVVSLRIAWQDLVVSRIVLFFKACLLSRDACGSTHLDSCGHPISLLFSCLWLLP